GLTLETIDEFLDGLNIVVEECDSLDMKAHVRERARARGIPVLMATSDRGLVDVERFDLEPQRPILHGLLGEVDPASLARMTSGQKVPYLARLLEAEHLSGRLLASVVEIDRTVSTWPQVSGDVVLGATAIAEAVRRIGLGEHLPSGRARLDIGGGLDQIDQPALPEDHALPPAEHADPVWPGVVGIVAAAAIRAPSASNAQPWRIDADADAITIRLAPEHTSTLDVGYRASAVALGAAVFNAKVAAAAHQVLGPVSIGEGAGGVPLQATLQLRDATDPQLAGLYDAMLARETNRRLGTAEPIPGDAVQLLHATAEREGAQLHLVTDPDEIIRAAKIFAESDRVRYLTPKLHAEMIAELRWPGDPLPDSGIDIRSLEFEPGELAMADILRRPEVMANLARWNAGSALGEGTRRQVVASSALAVISVGGGSLADYARGGAAAEAVWIIAEQRGYAVQPMSPIFLYARGRDDLAGVSTTFGDELARLQEEFGQLVGLASGAAIALVLRIAVSEPASVRSLRDFDRVNIHQPL
ncbi:MAG TPA: Rv1355c family protein, partial [Mycobacterium sp.]|uniref:Rv1355c family protein n=1 Tax=Mycobacterium sp. TaxID=1785 RepID=UPI002CDB0BFA